tara:strand:+ start:1019 stop:1219 length:201 start_codon:yes stop_codon:yes gene_type:complete
MEQATNSVGNPVTLLIERIFWLGLGCFLGATILRTFIQGLNQDNEKQQKMNKKIQEIANNATKKHD